MKNLGLYVTLGIVIVMAGLFFFMQNSGKLNLPGTNTVPQNGKNATNMTGGIVGGATQAPTLAPVVSQGLPLTITQPVAGATTTATTAVISGKTGPGVSVMINEHELRSTMTGDFSLNVSLDEGENYFSIVVYDDKGNSADTEIMVVRESVQ